MGAVGGVWKGEVLFEERNISAKLVLLLAVLGIFTVFVVTFVPIYLKVPDIVFATLFGLLNSLLIASVGLSYLAIATYPLIVYELGFEKRISIMSLRRSRSRFVDYSRVRSIHPLYTGLRGTNTHIGYTVVTVEGDVIEIRELDDRKLAAIRSALESGLKGRWTKLYAKTPYISAKQIETLRHKLSKSRKVVWGESALITIISFVVVLLPLLFSQYELLYYPAILLFFLGCGVSVRIVTSYNDAWTIYKKAVELDPSIKKLIPTPTVKGPEEENALQRALTLQDKQWKKIERVVNSRILYFLLLLGASLMFGDLLLVFFLPDWLFISMMICGLVVMLSPLLFIMRYSREVGFVSSLIEEELKSGRKLLPPSFEVKYGLMRSLPYREAPKPSEKQWKKLVSASKITTQRLLTVSVVLFVISIMVSIIVPIVLHLPKPVSFAIPMMTMSSWFFFFLVSSSRASRLAAIEKFEENSGIKVIPAQVRSQIHRDWAISRKR